MNFKIYIYTTFFLAPFFLFAQQKKKLSPFFSAIEVKSKDLESSKLFQKTKLFFLQHKWDSIIVYTTKQLNTPALNERKNDYTHFFRGYSFRRKRLFERAKEEFRKVSENFDFYERINIYRGQMALEQSEFEKAIIFFKKVMLLDASDVVGVRVGSIENNIGLCYLHLKAFDKAGEYLLKSIKAVEKLGDTNKLIGAYGNIATMYYDQLIDEKAIPYFKKAYELSKQAKSFVHKRKTAKNMAVVEENRKNFAKALSYRKEYERWNDSLNNQNRIYETAQLEKKKAVEKKQEEVKMLQAENEVKEAQKKVYLYSGIFLLFLLGILFSSYKGKVKRNKIITTQKENLDALNATKDKLFSIVSHDLRSSVHALKTSNSALSESLVTKNFNVLEGLLQTNSAIVNGAYNLLDNLLHWALLQTKQSYFEIASMRLFFIVEQVTYNYKSLLLEKNISFENKVLKSDVVYVDQESLKIILRNLIDNAIKFSNQNGAIKIYTRNKDAHIELVVEDTGLGMDEMTRLELLKETVLLSKKKNDGTIGTGLGLQLCKSMLKKNHGKLAIESELEKGTKMIVSLPKTLQNG